MGRGATLPYAVTPTGLDANTTSVCHATVCADPRYISPSTKMYHDIVASHGQLTSGGINFAAKLLSHHSSPWMYIPYALLVIGAVGLQYLQMARLNARNPQANQANPQAAMLQKYMPLIFGFIYLNVAAILNVYFIVSSAIRIGTQEVLFRRGMVPGPGAPAGGVNAKAKSTPSGGGSGKARTLSAAKDAGVESTERALPKPKGGRAGDGTGGNGSGATGKGPVQDTPEVKGSKPSANGSSNGSNGASTDGAGKKHPRSKAKRDRKAR